MAVPTKYYETDLVTTEDIFDVISLADYLIMESLYKVEFYTFTLQLKDLTGSDMVLPHSFEINKEVERLVEKITNNENYNAIFVNLYNFVRQEYDNNYQQFLMELLSGRYAMLQLNNIIDISASYTDDTEGKVVLCQLKDPEGRRYFHMVHSHAKFMETKDRIEKEKNQSFKAMMDGLGAVVTKQQAIPKVDIFAMPPPSPEDQKFVMDMFKQMLEDTMKQRNLQTKKNLEYEQLKKNKSIMDSDVDNFDLDDDDFLDENNEYDTFELDDTNDGR